MKQHRKSMMMLLAMTSGALLSDMVAEISALCSGMIAPILLFLMLFVSFCSVNLKDIKMSMLHVWIIVFQLFSAVATYYVLLPLGEIIAQGVMMCLLAPVAMAAIVVGGLLGANIATIASFSLVSNIVMAIFTPLFFIHIGSEGCSFMMIFTRVAPLMILPPIVAQIVRYTMSNVTTWINKQNNLSYYLWISSLVFTVGGTTHYIKVNIEHINLSLFAILSLGSLATCIIQYKVGGLFGKRYGDKVAGEQSLGQKNTILVIWMTQTFLSPIAAIAPTAYVIWQNLRNSYRIFRHSSYCAFAFFLVASLLEI